jgi:hypothetical protein
LTGHAVARSDSAPYFAPHNLCEYEIEKAEKKYGIPYRLFMAIGTVESGYALDSKLKRPYPWAICVDGKSYFFSTKSAAISAVRRLIARGKRNIDVGCMQVNLLHHSHAFKTLEEAFTPKHNVDYAARFFIELKNTYYSWTKAVGYYHSKVAKYYKPYCTIVYSAWTNVRNRVINYSPQIWQASSELKSKISSPSYYSLIDGEITAKLHQFSRKTLNRNVPKFFTDSDK